MQAFQVANVHLAIAVTAQACLNTPRSVFDEHQVLPVERCESLFVSPFYGRLNRRAQSAFDLVDQASNPRSGASEGTVTRTRASLRWLCGVASDALLRSHCATALASSSGWSLKVRRKPSSINCRERAAEHGQVEE